MLSNSLLPHVPGVYMILNSVNDHCYIGSTKDLQKRRRDHFRQLERGIHKNAHLQSAYNQYGPEAFTFHVLEQLDESDLIRVEQQYIDWLSPAYNLAPQAGSVTGIKRSPELIANLTAAAAAANKGRPKSPSSIEQLRATRRARREAGLYAPRVLTPEILAKRGATVRAKMEAGLYKAPNAGRKLSAESIAKRSATIRAKHEAGEWVPHNKGKAHTPEHRAKIGASLRGRKQSPELVAKRVATKKAKRELSPTYGVAANRKQSPETRAKIGAAHAGRKQSPESIAKRWATRKANNEAKRAPRDTVPQSGLPAKTGRKLSPETIAKREATKRAKREAGEYASTKGRVISAEQRAKLSASRMGRKLSAESIAKREATKRAKRLAQQQDTLNKFVVPDSALPDLDITAITPRSLWDDLP
jgi:group I intron endonuclease